MWVSKSNMLPWRQRNSSTCSSVYLKQMHPSGISSPRNLFSVHGPDDVLMSTWMLLIGIPSQRAWCTSVCVRRWKEILDSYLADDESYIYVQQLKFIIWRMLGLHTRFPSYWDMHFLTLSRDFQSVCSTSAFLPSVSTHHKWSSVVLRFSTNLSEELWFLPCFQFVQTEESSWPRYGQLKKDLELDYFISVTHFGGLVELLQDGNASWKIWETGEHKQSTWTMQHPLVHPIAYQHGTAKQRQRLLYHS